MNTTRSDHAPSIATPAPWLLYGVTGYTGRLIAELAVAKGQRPILAGRSRAAVEKIATALNCEARVFSLRHAEEVATHLKDVKAVLNCAGPFSQTIEPVLNACLRRRCHYLDITGEIAAFEWAQTRHAALCQAGITAIPGVGFDIVPSDCLAAQLKNQLPDATHLTLAFFSAGGQLSPGTAKTMVEHLGDGSQVRINGVIKSPGAPAKIRTITIAGKQRRGVNIPWGDVATAYYSTGIPNIEVYLILPAAALQLWQGLERGRQLLRVKATQQILQKLIGWFMKGPNATVRAKSQVFLWGEVKNAAGQRVSAELRTPDGYSLTALTAFAAMERLLASKNQISPGFQTPSSAFGAEFIGEFAGVESSQPVFTDSAVT